MWLQWVGLGGDGGSSPTFTTNISFVIKIETPTLHFELDAYYLEGTQPLVLFDYNSKPTTQHTAGALQALVVLDYVLIIVMRTAHKDSMYIMTLGNWNGQVEFLLRSSIYTYLCPVVQPNPNPIQSSYSIAAAMIVCPASSLKSLVSSVQCSVFSVQCSVSSVQWAL